jgi:hypothetical protein
LNYVTILKESDGSQNCVMCCVLRDLYFCCAVLCHDRYVFCDETVA